MCRYVHGALEETVIFFFSPVKALASFLAYHTKLFAFIKGKQDIIPVSPSMRERKGFSILERLQKGI